MFPSMRFDSMRPQPTASASHSSSCVIGMLNSPVRWSAERYPSDHRPERRRPGGTIKSRIRLHSLSLPARRPNVWHFSRGGSGSHRPPPGKPPLVTMERPAPIRSAEPTARTLESSHRAGWDRNSSSSDWPKCTSTRRPGLTTSCAPARASLRMRLTSSDEGGENANDCDRARTLCRSPLRSRNTWLGLADKGLLKNN